MHGTEYVETNHTGSVLALIERELDLKVTPETVLETLSIDSLDFVALIQCIRAEIGKLPTAAVQKARTVADLIAAIE